jgi:hypothetical protein
MSATIEHPHIRASHSRSHRDRWRNGRKASPGQRVRSECVQSLGLGSRFGEPPTDLLLELLSSHSLRKVPKLQDGCQVRRGKAVGKIWVVVLISIRSGVLRLVLVWRLSDPTVLGPSTPLLLSFLLDFATTDVRWGISATGVVAPYVRDLYGYGHLQVGRPAIE